MLLATPASADFRTKKKKVARPRRQAFTGGDGMPAAKKGRADLLIAQRSAGQTASKASEKKRKITKDRRKEAIPLGEGQFPGSRTGQRTQDINFSSRPGEPSRRGTIGKLGEKKNKRPFRRLQGELMGTKKLGRGDLREVEGRGPNTKVGKKGGDQPSPEHRRWRKFG